MIRNAIALLALALASWAAAAAPRVVADIAPVHSIAANVMAGVGEPGLLLPPGASPHDYALRPSEARRLQDADLVIWVGPDLTPWLADPIAALAPDASVLTLAGAQGVRMLPARGDGAFEADEDAPAGSGAGRDGHLWLDPGNAVAAARAMAAALSALDPANAAAYAANAGAFAAEMAAVARSLSAEIAPLRGRRFLVFHDAYQYFERYFAVPAAASVTLQEGVPPGAARVAALRDKVRSQGFVCAFAEPQFEPKLLGTVLEGSDVRTGVLDHLGATLPPGPRLYTALLQGIADGLVACLGD